MTTIEKIVDQSFSEATGRDPSEEPVGSGVSTFSWLIKTGDIIPPWWSKNRDIALSRLWKRSNHLSSALYNIQSKMTGIPPRVIAKNTHDSRHVQEAEVRTSLLQMASGFGKGWVNVYSKFIEDYLTQDNGAFMEVIGAGPPDGPIVGAPISLRHLDSFRCTRTANAEFPVIYTDTDGKMFKIHYTRVIYFSQMPSPKSEMNGVGLCAVSRCFDIAQNLIDITQYKQERLGSRPSSQLIVGKGISTGQIKSAFRESEEAMNNQGLRRFARTIVMGDGRNADIGLELVNLSHMDPFDEEVSVNLGMFVIASAIGMNADELWPVGGRASSKGEANLSRMRSRGRLPAQLTSELKAQIDSKFLPPHLEIMFDFQDDEEDMQRANIRDIRGRNRERDLGTGAVSTRVARIRMMEDRDLDPNSFRELEVMDGRLSDGTSISTLFFSNDPVYKRLLSGITDPLIFPFDEDEAREAITEVQRQRQVVAAEWSKTGSSRLGQKISNAWYALEWREDKLSLSAGLTLPDVPMQQRRMRTDIRVQPEQEGLDRSLPSSEAVSTSGGE